jgi:hypothetical protein
MPDARLVLRAIRPAFALALLLAPAVAAQTAPMGGAVGRRYQLRFLSVNDAFAVAQHVCPVGGVCEMSPSGHNEITILAEPSIHEEMAAALKAADLPPASQAFLLILLEAHRAPGSAASLPPDLPREARKAVEDVASFLPYGRFELLAPVAFLRTTAGPTGGARVTVGGDDQHAYELDLSFRGDPRQAAAELLVDRFRLRLVPAEPMLIALAQQPGFGPGATLPSRSAAGAAGSDQGPRPPASRPAAAANAGTPAPGSTSGQPTPPPTLAENLIATSFSIRKGETVVVGTSKLRGNDQALVVLLTALP